MRIIHAAFIFLLFLSIWFFYKATNNESKSSRVKVGDSTHTSKVDNNSSHSNTTQPDLPDSALRDHIIQNNKDTAKTIDKTSQDANAKTYSDKTYKTEPNTSFRFANSDIPSNPTDAEINQFLILARIDSVEEILKTLSNISPGQKTFLQGELSGTIINFAEKQEWTVYIGYESNANSNTDVDDTPTTDEKIVIKDAAGNIKYDGDGRSMNSVKTIGGTDQGVIINCGDIYVLQIYNFAGRGEIAGHFYYKPDKSDFKYGGLIKLTRTTN